jgi:hypothetical protein
MVSRAPRLACGSAHHRSMTVPLARSALTMSCST